MKPKSLLTFRHDPLATAVGFLLTSAGLPASAESIYWDGAANPGDWNTPANWSTASETATPNPGAKPGAADDVVFNIFTVNPAPHCSAASAC